MAPEQVLLNQAILLHETLIPEEKLYIDRRMERARMK